MTVFFTGLGSAADRTLFTRKGPIVKKPVSLLGSSNLSIVGPNLVSVPTLPFLQSHTGKQLRITGSPNGRNDGVFYIKKVLSSSIVQLENASFDWTDEAATLDDLCGLTNELQLRYNSHLSQSGIHVNPDTTNVSVSGFAVDAASAIIMLNALRTAFTAHVQLVYGIGGPVHIEPDPTNIPVAGAAYNVPSAILLVNDLRRKFEVHRQNDFVHIVRDQKDRIQAPEVSPAVGTGALVGPLVWTLLDPMVGRIADDPSDVTVFVNSVPVSVDAVFGLLGAIVLTTAPAHGDTVTVDYRFIANPPTQFERLNTPEFVLNEDGNNGLVGLPGHTYRARSHLMDPANSSSTIISADPPRRVGWKYKGIERAYSAVLNDPNTLLLNVPGNRVSYPVFEAQVQETTVRYDPTTTPDNAIDAWVLEGQGLISLAAGGTALSVIDNISQAGTSSLPPFYTHPLDLGFPGTVSAAFRMSAISDRDDGVMVGPGFGFTNGSKLILAGLLETQANNLSSAIALANDLKENFNAHLITTGTHRPNDLNNAVGVVDATDEVSLVILLNQLKKLFNRHIALGAAGSIHVMPDSIDVDFDPDVTQPSEVIAFVNVLASKFNAHRTQSGVHYVDDSTNVVGPVKQVGLLLDASLPELDTSWLSSAVDWTQTITYRLYKDADGNASLYTGGDVVPLASIDVGDLPAASDIDLKLDPVQQALFGSLSRQAQSTSIWNFVRINVTPLDFDQVVNNKSVIYIPTSVPEQDPFAPWITIGQGGYDRVVGPNLVLDSTASAPAGTDSALGLTTGAYRGFLRLEPILQRTTSSSVQFTANVGYYSFSVDNRASGIFMDDGDLSVHLVFLQETPSAATVTGTLSEPFPITAGDTAIISIDGAAPQTITFTFDVTDAPTIVNVINSQLPFPLATDLGGQIQFTNQSVGADTKIQIIGGHAIEKFGIPVGTYFGKDSNPEPKVSWFGEDLPELELTPWSTGGTQPARLLGRTLRITDASTTDYRAYSFTNPLYLSSIMAPASDWKFDFRCAVRSMVPGDQISAGSLLRPCGVLVNIDEGPSGKNIELHLALDSIGQQYVNVMSYNSGLSSLVTIAELPFSWNDGQYHSYDVYTSKGANLCIVLADNIPLGTFAYSALMSGVAGPAITFGSGGEQVANADLRSSQSVVDWASVCIFKDSKISDPLAPSRRFVGLYKGGDPTVLSSYYLHQIDWTLTHTYRIVRDPTSSVSVFIDTGLVPVISVNYDTLTLPPASSSFLRQITNSRHCVAFGSFNPFEVDRTVWGGLSYSIGKITLTNLRTPSHHVTNYGNSVVSPDHLFTQLQHPHFGFSVYSGGSPTDDFIADPNLQAYTHLGEGTPPVPMTQNLESRGGLTKVATPIESIASSSFINAPGFIGDLENDTHNITQVTPFVNELVVVVNAMTQSFNHHLTVSARLGNTVIPAHLNPDTFNTVVSAPATDLASAIALLNLLKAKYSSHLSQAAVHSLNDTLDVVSAANATDAASAFALVGNIGTVMNAHFIRWQTHLVQDSLDLIFTPDATTIPTLLTLLVAIKPKWNAHVMSTAYHNVPDQDSRITVSDPLDFVTATVSIANMRQMLIDHDDNGVAHPSTDFVDIPTNTPVITPADAFAAANDIKARMNGHFIVQGVHFVTDKADVFPYSLEEPVNNSVNFTNDLMFRYNHHLTQYRVHLNNDHRNLAAFPPATTVNDAIAIANALKKAFNSHRVAVVNDSNSHVHTNDDTVNVVSVADATDEDSLVTLCFHLWSSYVAHLTQTGVHASSVLIRLDPPDRVIYQGMKFHKLVEGAVGLTAPFSDDETLHMDGIGFQDSHSVGVSGLAFPEQAQLISGFAEPYVIAGGGEPLDVVVDGATTVVQLQSTDTTAALVALRINSYFAHTIAFATYDNRVALVSPTVGTGSSLSVSGAGSRSLGLNVPGVVHWNRVSTNNSQVSVSLVAVGASTALRYETLGSTDTAYRAATGLPDGVSLDFEVTFSVRINTWLADSTGDIGVFAGVSGIVGPGFTAAIGFEDVFGTKYVKIQDLNAGKTVFRVLFNWADGNFHTYKLVRSALRNAISLVVVS